MSERYTHVAHVVSEVHDQLVGWSRKILRSAGLETLEVYGQFPPEGTTSSYVVLFPYRLGPAPKVVETSQGMSLLGPKRAIPEKGSGVPWHWAELGRNLAEAMKLTFPVVGASKGYPRPHPAPEIGMLPKPLQKWYKAQPEAGINSWTAPKGKATLARLPSLWWRPAFTMTTHYMAVANDGGRGTSERSSMDAPIALPGLSVIAAGLHLERTFKVRLPPLPVDPALWTMCDAYSKSVKGELGEKIMESAKALQEENLMSVQVVPVHDLTNMDFANLMQALQRPLQPALNLAVRMPLGADVALSPSVSPRFAAGDPMGGPTGRTADQEVPS